MKELESAGFTDVTSEDLNEDFMKISKAELKAFTSAREAFISDFSEEDFAEISSTLANKVSGGERLHRRHWRLFIFIFCSAHDEPFHP